MSNKSKDFFGGLLLLVLGIVLVMMNTTVRFSLYSLHVGGTSVTSGLLLLPFFIGIILSIAMEKKVIGHTIVWVSLAFILLALILSLRFTFQTMSMFMVVLIFLPAVIGVGLILKAVLSKE